MSFQNLLEKRIKVRDKRRFKIKKNKSIDKILYIHKTNKFFYVQLISRKNGASLLHKRVIKKDSGLIGNIFKQKIDNESYLIDFSFHNLKGFHIQNFLKSLNYKKNEN